MDFARTSGQSCETQVAVVSSLPGAALSPLAAPSRPMQAVQTDLALELARLELALAGGDYTVCYDLLDARASVEAEMLMSRIKAGDSSSTMISKLLVAQETVRSLKADRETILLSVASVSTALPSRRLRSPTSFRCCPTSLRRVASKRCATLRGSSCRVTITPTTTTTTRR
mmetsp:Transcript_20258/g.51491  ORF Transcript_20258/g.51491 Transcript_20258/m.51491 type:complete len:171 (+) Transcript_20258:255-767(+)